MVKSSNSSAWRGGCRLPMALGMPLALIGLFLVMVLPSGRLPWHATGHTQVVPDCAAGAGTNVCVQPPSQTVETGAEFTVDIVVDDVAGLGAYEFTLAFDPALISFVGVTNGSFLGSTGRAVSCPGLVLASGRIKFGCVTIGEEPSGPSGTGLLARVRFFALAAGTSSLDLTDVVIGNVTGRPLSHTDLDGQATVVVGPTATPCPGGVCPTATATPVPTSTPTPSLGPTSVRIDPASQSVDAGSVVNVNVVVDAVTNLGGYEFTLAFNPEVLEFVSVSNGPFLEETGRDLLCLPPMVGANTVRLACGTAGSAPPGPDGSGILAALVFLAPNAGVSFLDLFAVGLSQPLGVPIPTAVQDGTVTVTPVPTPTPCPGGVCPTPTPTRTASPTPTATASRTPTATSTPTWPPIDTDGDGCRDGQEAAMGFDPLDPYDFYDVPVPANADPTPNGSKNRLINVGDTLALLRYVGTFDGDGGTPNANGVSYDSDKMGPGTKAGLDYDRSASPAPNPPWGAGPPDGAVSINDVLVLVAQVGLNCSGVP
jgi:hypothetical protein